MNIYLASVKKIQSTRDPSKRNHVLIRDMYPKFIYQSGIHRHTVPVSYKAQGQDICETRGVIPHREIAKLSLLVGID